MDILSEYRKAIEGDSAREIDTGDTMVDERVREIMDDPNSMENVYRRYHEEYKNVSESQLSISDEPVTVVVRRANCPDCGAEIRSPFGPMNDPFTAERVSRYDCPKCGAKMNLEHSYPRIVYLNSIKEEIKAY